MSTEILLHTIITEFIRIQLKYETLILGLLESISTNH